MDAGTIHERAGGYEVDPDGPGPASSFFLGHPDFNMRSLRGNRVMRWKSRPGSTLFLVWQQERYDTTAGGQFRLREGADALVHLPPENVFALKVTYWLGI